MNNYYPHEHWVICDDCGRKMLASQTMLITDRYNQFNGMIICKEHYEKANPGLWPDRNYERQLKVSDKIRPRQAPIYDSLSNDEKTTLPSMPLNLKAELNTFNECVTLTWDGPEVGGSGRLLGYSILRSMPQLSIGVVINSNTQTNITSYDDLTADTSQYYSYRVAAINEVGQGPYSEAAYYPIKIVNSTIQYLTASQDHRVIVAGDGRYITVRRSV